MSEPELGNDDDETARLRAENVTLKRFVHVHLTFRNPFSTGEWILSLVVDHPVICTNIICITINTDFVGVKISTQYAARYNVLEYWFSPQEQNASVCVRTC